MTFILEVEKQILTGTTFDEQSRARQEAAASCLFMCPKVLGAQANDRQLAAQQSASQNALAYGMLRGRPAFGTELANEEGKIEALLDERVKLIERTALDISKCAFNGGALCESVTDASDQTEPPYEPAPAARKLY